MNHFAHLVLSQPTTESTVGNLLGDFMRGVDVDKLSPAVKRGLENHRAVDRYTDSDMPIGQLKKLFSPQRRRFAGVALDIWFDHLLISHWKQLENGSVQEVIDNHYALLRDGQGLMPPTMRRITTLMIDNDWFGHYRDVDSVARALNRVAGRIRFHHRFDDSIEDILGNQDTIREHFLDFYPRLRAHIRDLAIEQPAGKVFNNS